MKDYWTNPKSIAIPDWFRRITHGKVRATDLVHNIEMPNGHAAHFGTVSKTMVGTRVGYWWLVIRQTDETAVTARVKQIPAFYTTQLEVKPQPGYTAYIDYEVPV